MSENMIHPCKCTDYNGGQCYNCLNGAHDICHAKRKCGKRSARQIGLVIRAVSEKPAAVKKPIKTVERVIEIANKGRAVYVTRWSRTCAAAFLIGWPARELHNWIKAGYLFEYRKGGKRGA